MVAARRGWAAVLVLALSSLASKRSAAEAFALPVGQEPNNKATQIMQGTGPVSVDMNRYNLESLEDILEEWRLSLRQKAAEQEVTLFLDTRSPDLFVDIVNVRFPRQKDSGLGIELAELAGGREDGLGITVVTGLVEGGPAEAVDIFPGDVIAKVNLVRRKRKRSSDRLTDREETMQLRTEGLGYDATVDTICGLPAADDLFEDFFQMQLKRIRRKPRIKVKLQYPPAQGENDTSIELFAGENLRMGMLLRGVLLNDALAQRFDAKESGNCGANGICRTCSVSILKGGELLNPQRPNEKQIFENAPRWRLACKAIVGYGMRDGDMTIRVNPTQFD